jgi:hypothetical protein
MIVQQQMFALVYLVSSERPTVARDRAARSMVGRGLDLEHERVDDHKRGSGGSGE